MEKVNSVEEYIETHEKWSEALIVLRNIILSTEAVETLKWSAPVYTINEKNVLGLGAFKQHFGLWFFNGVFLKDKKKLLVNAQEGKTKALRQMRFTSIEDIDKNIVLAYVKEAIENQKLGKEIKADRSKKETIIPIEFQEVLAKDSNLTKHFNSLSPYKQREYCEHIASAKLESTKVSRLDKIKPMILQEVGLHDKYKNC
ncbi:YdeI/OmpD-associated family protein [Olleya sp. AH-315-F22]|nr:YdeI/OmpD-associated family protein [Olleya sp. AH-315-F22]